jgi:hypothetical protein
MHSRGRFGSRVFDGDLSRKEPDNAGQGASDLRPAVPAPMTKDAWFAVKVAGLNALAFSITLAGVTWIDARLTSHVSRRWEYCQQ